MSLRISSMQANRRWELRAVRDEGKRPTPFRGRGSCTAPRILFRRTSNSRGRFVSDKHLSCIGVSTFPRLFGSRSPSSLTANNVPPPMLNEVAVRPRVPAQPRERFRVEVDHFDLDL